MRDALRGGLVLAAESGVTDAAYANARAGAIDAVTLGGLAVDGATRRAARAMVARDRDEFLPADVDAYVAGQLRRLDGDVAAAVNVRAASPAAIERVATVCADAGAAVEINAHCRQPEMVERGCGHALLRDTDRLAAYVRAAAATDAVVGVKTRAEVGDPAAAAGAAVAAGADYLHLDCMDSPDAVDRVAAATPDALLVANNGVRCADDARDYLDRGADAVSTARGGRDPARLERIRRGLPVPRC